MAGGKKTDERGSSEWFRFPRLLDVLKKKRKNRTSGSVLAESIEVASEVGRSELPLGDLIPRESF